MSDGVGAQAAKTATRDNPDRCATFIIPIRFGARSGAPLVCLRGRVEAGGRPPELKIFRWLVSSPYQPPSTPIAWPVTKAAWSEARKAMTAATSSGVPKRPTGIALARSLKPISRSSPYSRRLVLIAREVRIGPGQTALTVIPNGARSSARDLVKPTIAAFEAA